MTKGFMRINNETGSLMFVALLIMAALTVAGMMVMDDTIMENRIARNYAISRQNMYLAEAGTKEAAQSLDLMSGIDDFEDLMGEGDTDWINKTGSDTTDAEDSAIWVPPGDSSTISDPLNAAASVVNGNTEVNSAAYYAVDFDPPPLISGDDVDVSYSVYGLCQSNNDQGEALIEIGFQKRVRVP